MVKKDSKKTLDFGFFKADIDNINKTAENISDPIERTEFYFRRAEHYKHLSQIDGIRDEAKDAMKYLICISKRLEKKC